MAILRDLGEFGLIEKLAQRLKVRGGVKLGIGDDGAILNALQTPIVTCDALVEGVHFRRDWMSATQIGRKALAVNVSDLAACGARPVAAFVTLAASPETQAEWIFALYDGMESVCEEFQFTTAGGDTVSSAQIVISITLIGELLSEAQQPIARDGAQIGDVLAVSGTLGDSAAGLEILRNSEKAALLNNPDREFLLERHCNPTPRLALMRELLKFHRGAIHAALDLSDGLGGDAKHMAKRSKKRLIIEAQRLPLSPQLQNSAPLLESDAIESALAGGEDYELLLAIAPEHWLEIARVADVFGVPLTQIGTVENGEGVEIWQNKTPRETRGAWTHF